MRQIRLWEDPDYREKMSEAHKGNKVFHSPETRRKISRSKMGHAVSAKTRRRMSSSLTGRIATIETRAKLSAALKGRRQTASHRKANRQSWTPERREFMRRKRLQQKLPTKDTRIERSLSAAFDEMGLEYEKHVPVFWRFVPDFTFASVRLFVQADGDYWHSLPGNARADKAFAKVAKENGWVVLRFSEAEINASPEGCAEIVAVADA